MRIIVARHAGERSTWDQIAHSEGVPKRTLQHFFRRWREGFRAASPAERSARPLQEEVDLIFRILLARSGRKPARWEDIAADEGIPKRTLQRLYCNYLTGVGAYTEERVYPTILDLPGSEQLFEYLRLGQAHHLGARRF